MIIKSLLVILKIALLSCIFLVKRAFFEQSSMAVLKSPLRVLSNGFIVFVAFVGIIGVFFFSVVGAPVSAAFFIVLYILTLCGEISAAILIGRVSHAPNALKKTFSYANLPFGVIIIEVAGYLPFVGFPLRLLLFPVTFTGIAVTGFINGFINKTFYEL